ncbi:MAG: helix-turn-helix transcriptional regulator [Acidobacteriota bacterium]|nr:helix-turn-helix transcriptional regulator [Acidobacteriota bacterium]
MQEATRLDTFMKARGIKPAKLARVAYISRQHLMRVRTGEGDPTRHVMVRLMMACTLILHRKIRMDELFDLTDAGL